MTRATSVRHLKTFSCYVCAMRTKGKRYIFIFSRNLWWHHKKTVISIDFFTISLTLSISLTRTKMVKKNKKFNEWKKNSNFMWKTCLRASLNIRLSALHCNHVDVCMLPKIENLLITNGLDDKISHFFVCVCLCQ